MTNMKTAFSFENVERAYNGKSGCMCGCNGDYAESVNPEDMKKLRARYKKVMSNPNMKIDISASCAYLEENGRNTVVYFK